MVWKSKLYKMLSYQKPDWDYLFSSDQISAVCSELWSGGFHTCNFGLDQTEKSKGPYQMRYVWKGP